MSLLVSSPHPGSPSSIICVVGSPVLGSPRLTSATPAPVMPSTRQPDCVRVRTGWLSPKEQWDRMARPSYSAPRYSPLDQNCAAQPQLQTRPRTSLIPIASGLPPRSTSLYALAAFPEPRPVLPSTALASPLLAAEQPTLPAPEIVSCPSAQLELRWEPDPEQREYDAADRAWDAVERMLGRMVRDPSVRQRGQWVVARKDECKSDMVGKRGEYRHGGKEDGSEGGADQLGEIVDIYLDAVQEEDEEAEVVGLDGVEEPRRADRDSTAVSALAPAPANTPVPITSARLSRLGTLPSRRRLRDVDEESCITFTGGTSRSTTVAAAPLAVPPNRADHMVRLDSHMSRTLRALQEDEQEGSLHDQVDH